MSAMTEVRAERRRVGGDLISPILIVDGPLKKSSKVEAVRQRLVMVEDNRGKSG